MEQRSQGDRTAQPGIQFPLLIHYSHTDFYLWDEDFHFEVTFNFHVPNQHKAAFILTKDICVTEREFFAQGTSSLKLQPVRLPSQQNTKKTVMRDT